METNRAACIFTVKAGPDGQRSIAVDCYGDIPALSSKTLSFEINPEATPEQAETFARVLKQMVAFVVVSG